ncbi:MAG: hypothetical protein ACRDO2_10215 [Nocardioidaceae bacterium]
MFELFLTVIAGLAFLALLECVLPHHRKHWWSRLARVIQGLGRRTVRRPPALPDPFEVLRVQHQLGELSSQIRRLEGDPRAYARVHRLEAVQAAYDDLLREGCRLAGVPGDAGDADAPDAESRRWHEEQALAERGWSW